MSIETLILGKLHQRAEQRTGKTGRPFVTGKVRAATGEADAVFVNVVCFSESVGAALLALDAGDAVALAGTFKPGAWIDREGNARPSLDMVAAQVLTVYGLTKKRAALRAAADMEIQGRVTDQPPARTPASDADDDIGDGAADPWLNGGAL